MQVATLPATGTYYAVVHATNLGNTGNYNLGLERLAPAPTAGESLPVRIDRLGGFNPSFNIHPGCTRHRTAPTSPSSTPLWSRPFACLSDGTYLIVVISSDLRSTGAYQVRVGGS